eukprot:TRINITY_DN1389_c0_g1_i3.p1 TRINITY_DN1389_c0_g1~~TRINITY_DN1389_c0_g1_i3.p1  ORF type:complete len:196 (-),score=43.25 TRINITY_DN1389_c0_g1_i3:58-645(-)
MCIRDSIQVSEVNDISPELNVTSKQRGPQTAMMGPQLRRRGSFLRNLRNSESVVDGNSKQMETVCEQFMKVYKVFLKSIQNPYRRGQRMREIISNDHKLRALILTTSCRRVKEDMNLDYMRSHLLSVDISQLHREGMRQMLRLDKDLLRKVAQLIPKLQEYNVQMKLESVDMTAQKLISNYNDCLLYTSPSPRDS